MRSINELYNESVEITNFDINYLYFFFVNSEPMSFDEAMRDKMVETRHEGRDQFHRKE